MKPLCNAEGALQVASFVRAVLRTLSQCHAHRILHRDIKPGNFMLLNDNYRAPLKAIGKLRCIAHRLHPCMLFQGLILGVSTFPLTVDKATCCGNAKY